MRIVFDIGGTNMRVARATPEGLGDVQKVATPKNPKEGIETLLRLAHECSRGERFEMAVGGIRGRVVDGVFVQDNILTQWEGTKIAEVLSHALGGLPVHIVHDTALAGLGEAHYGAARGSKISAYVTVSTGVGGDRIVDGRIDRATYNPEIGRQMIDGEELENLVSGTAVQKKFGVHPKDLDSLEEREKLADILATGLYNTAVHWSPDTFVLGGSMIVGKNPIPLVRVRESFAKYLTMYPTVPTIKMAELSDEGGLHGGRAFIA